MFSLFKSKSGAGLPKLRKFDDNLFICGQITPEAVAELPGMGIRGIICNRPDGEGAKLLRRLLTHVTQPQFVYIHEWAPGDLVIGDNRNLLHAATWYDAQTHNRLMWRTTVMGNPGEEYAGEAKSWIPAEGFAVMQGMEDA